MPYILPNMLVWNTSLIRTSHHAANVGLCDMCDNTFKFFKEHLKRAVIGTVIGSTILIAVVILIK